MAKRGFVLPMGGALPASSRATCDVVREMCEEFGLLRDGRWDEMHLCHSPQERLFRMAAGRSFIEPDIGSNKRDHEQFQRFQRLIAEAKASGQYTIPSNAARRYTQHWTASPSAVDARAEVRFENTCTGMPITRRVTITARVPPMPSAWRHSLFRGA